MQETSDNFVQLSYTYSYPPSKLWQAWTHPSIVKMWFGSDPDGTVLEAELDVHVNGSFKVRFANSDGTEHTATGVYNEVEPNKRLAFTWGWKDRPEVAENVSVEFTSENGVTVMSFEHHNIDKNTAHNYAEGWESTFKKFKRALNNF